MIINSAATDKNISSLVTKFEHYDANIASLKNSINNLSTSITNLRTENACLRNEINILRENVLSFNHHRFCPSLPTR